MASAFLIYGIALIYGTSGTMAFDELAAKAPALRDKPIFLLGVCCWCWLVSVSRSRHFRFRFGRPMFTQGAPAPTTAFLAVGSKAAGFVLLLRLFLSVVPESPSIGPNCS